MSAPLTTFTDAQLAVCDLLRPALVASSASYAAGAAVGTKLGTTRPFVLVRQDAAFPRYPVDERVTVRVACWHSSEFKALALVRLCMAYLGSTSGTVGGIRATRPLTGPVPTTDPDTGEPLAYATCAVHTWPVPLT